MNLNTYLIFNFLYFSSFFFFHCLFFIIFNRRHHNRLLLSKIIKKKIFLTIYSCFRYKNINFSRKCVIILNDNVYNKYIRIRAIFSCRKMLININVASRYRI